MSEKQILHGLVYLVGAGPGEPGLLTIRGKECLARADVVIHDYLASEEILSYAKNAKEIFYAGKQVDCHAMEQDEINSLIITKAQEGKTVVRLKGGDPYIFGRGGEEAMELQKAGIAFEVVPGITSGIAAATYSGIPATHRATNSVLTLVTGHEDPKRDQSHINWPALATGGGTLIFYMGVRNLSHIVQQLIQCGRSQETPVAVVQWATLPIQKVVEGTLDTIEEKVRDADLTPPCIIIVGEVVKFREHLNWFERRPLFGKTILLTRSREQSSELAEKFSSLGARVLLFPTIRFAPPEDHEKLGCCLNALGEYDWVIFTSANAVEFFFTQLHSQGKDSRSLGGCRICCIGPGTSARLGRYGLFADLVPERFASAAVFDALAKRNEICNKRFLLPRSNIAGKELIENLQSAGAQVTDVEAYRTLPGDLPAAAREALEVGEVDIVTFASSSAVHNFASIVRREIGRLPEHIFYASIGPETSKAAGEEGMKIHAEAKEQTLDGLVDAVFQAVGGDKP